MRSYASIRRDDHRVRRACLKPAAVLALATLWVAQPRPALAEPAEPLGRTAWIVEGITTPSAQATLGAVLPGRLAGLLVPEGGTVLAGGLVFQLDDGVQRVRTQMARAAAQSTLPIDLARARWRRAERERDRLLRLYGDASASNKEMTDAISAEEITQLEHQLAEFEHAQAVRVWEREEEALAQFQGRAPFAGYVASHLKQPGDTVNENEGVVRIVQLDPLLVNVDCPLTLATHVHSDHWARVTPLDIRWPARRGQIVLASAVIDAASQTFKVKLTVDNADQGWPAGLKVAVDFSTSSDDPAEPAPARPTASTALPHPPSPAIHGGGSSSSSRVYSEPPRSCGGYLDLQNAPPTLKGGAPWNAAARISPDP